MSKIKHIKGPWTYEYDKAASGHGAFVVDSDECSICTIDSYEDVAEANAKLIAAAPELLEALELALNLLEEHQGEAKWYLRGHYNRITAAIKKATQ